MTFINTYDAGRFAYLMEKPFAAEVWAFLESDKTLAKMVSATEEGKPAIAPILAEIESLFGGHLASPENPKEEIAVFINSIIKHIMEQSGYEFIACGFCRNSRYIKSSGLFRKKPHHAIPYP